MNWLVTLSVGQTIPENVLESFEDAAQRWDAEVLVLDSPLTQKWAKISPHKLLIGEQLPAGVHRVFYVDSDLIIRGDAPSPFEMVAQPTPFKKGWIAGVRDEQPMNPRLMANLPSINAYLAVAGFELDVDHSRFINGGVLLWDWPAAKPVFDLAIELFDRANGCEVDCWEQAALNISIQHLDFPLHLLPVTFNRIGAALNKLPDAAMLDYIYHFAGRNDRHRLETINWRNIPNNGRILN